MRMSEADADVGTDTRERQKPSLSPRGVPPAPVGTASRPRYDSGMDTAFAPPETVRPDTAPPKGWAATLGAIGALFLGGVFLVATYGKVLDPIAFAEVMEIEGLDFLVPAMAMAPFILALEAFFGFALVLNLRKTWVLVPLTGMVLFFIFLTGRTYLKDLQGIKPETASCGCFGNLLDRTPGEAFFQDLLLLVPPLVLSWFGRPKGPPRVPKWRTGIVMVLTLGTLLFAWKAPELPLDDLATKLRPGLSIGDVCAGGGEDRLCLDSEALGGALTNGEHLVLIADLKDETFVEEVINRLDELVEAEAVGRLPRILVLFSGSKDDVSEFNFKSMAPPFDFQDAPAGLCLLYTSDAADDSALV